MSTASEKQTEEELRSLCLNRVLKKGELQGATVGTLTGAGLGALGSLGYAALKHKSLTFSTPVLGSAVGLAAGDLAGIGLGLKRYFEGEKGSVKKAAVTPDEVIPPGGYVPPSKPAAPAGKLVPRSEYKFDRLPESIVGRVRRGLGDLKAGWQTAGKAWSKSTGGRSRKFVGKAVDALRDDKAVLGFDLLQNRLEGAKGVPFLGRVGGAARMLGPQAAVAAGTLIPAALLIKAFKEDKQK